MDKNKEMPTPLKPLTDEERGNKLREFRHKNSGNSIVDMRKKILERQKQKEPMKLVASEIQETTEEQMPTEETPKKKRRSKKVEQ